MGDTRQLFIYFFSSGVVLVSYLTFLLFPPAISSLLWRVTVISLVYNNVYFCVQMAYFARSPRR